MSLSESVTRKITRSVLDNQFNTLPTARYTPSTIIQCCGTCEYCMDIDDEEIQEFTMEKQSTKHKMLCRRYPPPCPYTKKEWKCGEWKHRTQGV